MRRLLVSVTVVLALVGCQSDDPRLAIEPDIPIELSSEDFFAGRDPALRAAVRPGLR